MNRDDYLLAQVESLMPDQVARQRAAAVEVLKSRGWTFSGIAEHVGVTPGAVNNWLHRSMQPKGEDIVYFVRRSDGCVKIGHSAQHLERINRLVKEHGDLVLHGTEPGGLEREQWLHEHFADERVRGEWFRGSRVDAYVAAVTRG